MKDNLKDVSLFDVPDRWCSVRNISDQTNACAQRKDKDWKYEKKSVAGELVCKF